MRHRYTVYKNSLTIIHETKMAKKDKTQYMCSECGETHQRWLGQCSCGAWNTIIEFKEAKAVTQRTPHAKAHKGYSIEDAKIENLSKVSDTKLTRFDTGVLNSIVY